MTENFDAIIIGSGQGGNPLAGALAAAGKKTALIERQDVGGTCINRGCTPTKTMVASARVAYLARRGGDYGVDVGPIAIDMGRVRERKRAIVRSFREGGEKRLANAHVELIRGEASFTGPRTIRVALLGGGERQLSAAQIFINTGTRRCRPADCRPRYGSLSRQRPHHGSGLCARAPADSGRWLYRAGVQPDVSPLRQQGDGDPVRTAALAWGRPGRGCKGAGDPAPGWDRSPAQRARGKGGAKRRHSQSEGRGRRRGAVVEGPDLLVATGRVPNTGALKPAAGGIGLDEHGFIRTNQRLETSAPGVYAIGEVKGGPQFTHISYDDYRILKTNLLEGGNRTVGDRMVPYTVFMDPQLGRVGMTESEARQSGRKIRVARMPMSSVARALEVDETRGLMKAVVDAETEEILGATVLGIEGGEVMAVFQMAMMGRVKYSVLRDAVFAHPTLAESLNNLFLHFDDQK